MDNNFRRNVLKLNSNRIHKINNSYGIRDFYKHYKKNTDSNIKESTYSDIIKDINTIISINLSKNKSFKIPNNLGIIEIRKYNTYIKYKDGIVTNLPIDWNKTLHLWEEDIEAYNNKVLIRIETKEVFKLYYNKKKAKFRNKSYYEFNFNRRLKHRIKTQIEEGNLDAFLFKNN